MRTCQYCGKAFTPPPSNVAKGYGLFCSRQCGNTQRRGSLTDRFWALVTKTDECWIWNGSINKAGYGYWEVQDRPIRIRKMAHRVAWELERCFIPDGLVVCHACD